MFIQAPNSQLITLFQPVKKVGVQLDSAMQQNFTSLCGSFQNIKKVIHCGNFCVNSVPTCTVCHRSKTQVKGQYVWGLVQLPLTAR